MNFSIDDVRSSDTSNLINEVASQITCEVNNTIEDFIVSNVNEYGGRHHNWVQVNAEKICEAIMNSREDKKTEQLKNWRASMNKVELLRDYTNYLKSICFESYDGALLDYLEMNCKEKVEDESIAYLSELSMRTKNALRRSGYQTFEDIKNDLRWEHGEVRNLGNKGIDEIEAFLRRRNVRFDD